MPSSRTAYKPVGESPSTAAKVLVTPGTPEFPSQKRFQRFLEDGQAACVCFVRTAHGVVDVAVIESGVRSQESGAGSQLGELIGEVVAVRLCHDEDEVGIAQGIARGEARSVREVRDSRGQEEAPRRRASQQGSAAIPQELTSRSRPRTLDQWRRRCSAMAERQMLPVQTKTMRREAGVLAMGRAVVRLCLSCS